MRYHYFHICRKGIKLKVKSPGFAEANEMQITIYDNISQATVFSYILLKKEL